MTTLSVQRTNVESVPQKRSEFGYRVMLAFSFLYYLRPGDIIPGLSVLHLARVTAAAAVLGLLLGTNKGRPRRLPLEVKIIIALFGWMILTIPFAYWRGGSLELVFFEFSKIVIVALALTFTVSHLSQLRRLIFVQVFAVTLMTIVSAIVGHTVEGRLGGVNHALLENPNGLAMNIAMNWPLCLVFFLTARGLLKKAFWGLSMLIMIYAVTATYSRAGFVALLLAIVLCLWDFGIRGKRLYMLGGAVICLLALTIIMPRNYGKRLETLVGKFQEGDLDRGSAEARQDLLLRSLKVTADHPIFGVGPGNFSAYTGFWHVTHNTYTQFSSECGVPALLLFLLLLGRASFNLRSVRRARRSSDSTELILYANALRAALAAYIMAAFFCSSAYDLFPYYIVMYTTILYRLAQGSEELTPQTVVRTTIPTRQGVYGLT